MIARRHLHVAGIVQGVGFRPFVYRLASRLRLAGWVLNATAGVEIEVEGRTEDLDQFVQLLATGHPPFAHIEETVVTALALVGETSFQIRESSEQKTHFVLVSPDLATCDDCLRELNDPANRRFGYPFINCTNCGPRYTILRDIPYDRPQTSMSVFPMCPACQVEYDNPADRRFHAQPNACPDCGPALTFAGDATQPEDAIAAAQALLAAGGVLALKALGGFQLACDAENEGAVRQLRNAKHRGDKPFAVMARDLAAVEQYGVLTGADRATLTNVRRPIVLIPRRPESTLAPSVAPGTATLGVMLPCTPLHHLLFRDAPFRLLVMSSGNISEEPIVTNNEEARRHLSGVATGFLLHNREIEMRVDDSVVRNVAGHTRVLRRARGYAPLPIDLGAECEEVLACGAGQKNTLCLTKGHYALLSQHIGDLSNCETLEFFNETLARMRRLFHADPRIVAHDLHPDYLSTRFALSLEGVERIGVQHHHAHIVSCMAEHRLSGPVIGVAFDGTGLGTDGHVWGGEFLVSDLTAFERRAHLRYIPLAGGDQAIREPWRAALSYLDDAIPQQDLSFWNPAPQSTVALIRTMRQRRINTVQTSSCGRLFDAVASIIGLRHHASYEGQAAIELEAAAAPDMEERYAFTVQPGSPLQLDMRPAIAAITADLRRGESTANISARFHNTVAAAIVDICVRIRADAGLNRVCLSGGTFQNVYLLSRADAALRRSGFAVFLHARIPPNDGGIALGQAVIANRIWQTRQRNERYM